MVPSLRGWDYLIITASNYAQAEAYRALIGLRERLGLIRDTGKILVVPDPGGRRVGSGGSTVHCLLQVLDLEVGTWRKEDIHIDHNGWAEVFDRLRILVVHAGGDSRRLPPYGPCGKILVPLPGDAGGVLGTTLFDRLIPTYQKLPLPASGKGQVVVASGDVLLDFDAANVVFSEKGVTGVGAFASPDAAQNHGVYTRREDGVVRRFLQKPSAAKQLKMGATDSHARSILDIGILNFDAQSVARLLKVCGVGEHPAGKRVLPWNGPVAEAIGATGLDIYCEICCALGTDTRFRDYRGEVRDSGSKITDEALRAIYRGLRAVPFHVHVLPHIRFLHFGTLQDLIQSGQTLLSSEMSESETGSSIVIDSRVRGQGAILGKNAWVEGCRVDAPLRLSGDNVVVGADITKPLTLPRAACLDIINGGNREGKRGWFVRVYTADDTLHKPGDRGGSLCGLPVSEWLKRMGSGPSDVWGPDRTADGRTVWSGRFFPFIRKMDEYLTWLFLLEPGKTTASQKNAWIEADRYSLEEITLLADLGSFHSRRIGIRADLLLAALPSVFGPEGKLSAEELGFLVRSSEKSEQKRLILAVLYEALKNDEAARTRGGLNSLELSRILHTLGTVLLKVTKGTDGKSRADARAIASALKVGLTASERRRLRDIGVPIEPSSGLQTMAGAMKDAAFRHLGRTIVTRTSAIPQPPKNVLRSDEIVWGRAPARLDLGGGWTDTPPYSLERGGCVINAAVELNGQAPIQAYARIIDQREIRINSIDHSMRVVVRTLEELLDYRKPGNQFALAKAALALTGFSPGAAEWPTAVRSLDQMLRHFGGGIELTTLAAIPSGSGLGTSSIMGAVLMSIISRIVGRPLTSRELFHAVLKLEQELTTGGGWQDQIGGAVEGVKMITAGRGLIPDPRIQFVPADLLDPSANGGSTLLYYTGLRRLAKNILRDVVGRYLDRDRGAMETLRQLHAFPPVMAKAMAMRDAEKFGELIDIAWKLNVNLDPDHTTPVIEELRARIRPHVLGSKLLGAGGGGFLLMICKSLDDAAEIKGMLEKSPPNDKARFFHYSINQTGLIVTVC
jgi:galactokinase/mevalonate kinase-like predicted kinase